MSVEKVDSHVEEEEIDEDEEQDEGEDAFTCKYCNFQTLDVDCLDEHIVTHDEALLEDALENVSDAECDIIEEAPSSSNELPSAKYSIKGAKQKLPAYFHEYTNRGKKKVFVCAYCGYQTMKKADLDRHVDNHRDPVELPVYRCGECPYTTRRKCDMPKHLLTHCDVGTVPKLPKYKCETCSYITTQKCSLSSHMKVHMEETTLFKCSECEYLSKRQGDLKKHERTHRAKSPFQCSDCGYISKRLNDLHKHAMLHCDRAVKGAFKCVKCDYASLVGNAFAKHLLSNCTINNLQVPLFTIEGPSQGNVHLEVCVGDLINQEKVPMYNCEKCSYSTKRKGDLSKHMLLHMDKATQFKCPECEYSSKRHGDLKKHLLCHGAQHTRELFQCSECGYTSKRLNDLHKHAVLHCDRAVKGAFKCVKCDYASFAGNAFAKHLLSNCTINNLQVALVPKEGSAQEYVLLEQNDVQATKERKANPSYKDKITGKRSALGSYQSESKRTNTAPFIRYRNAVVENPAQTGSNKVVILAGFEDGVSRES